MPRSKAVVISGLVAMLVSGLMVPAAAQQKVNLVFSAGSRAAA
jgi:hypothetical protein